MCEINEVLWAESHWLVKEEETRGKWGSIINVCLFNLSVHVLTSSFFPREIHGKGWENAAWAPVCLISGWSTCCCPWHFLGIHLGSWEDWFSYGHVSFERENQAGKRGVKGEWGWQRELCLWSWGAHCTTPSSYRGHCLQCQTWPALKSLFVHALQLVLSIDTALGPALLPQQLIIVKGQAEERGLGLLISERMP